MRRRGRLAALAALAMSVVTAAAFTSAAQGVHAEKGPKPGPSAAGCQLGDKGKIKHVIYLQFDNVHFLRDNPNVPSDLEQMPHLLELPQGQRHVRHERPHDSDLAHGRRDPQLAHRPLSGPARAGRLELVRLLQARRLGRLLVHRSSTGRTSPTAATRRTLRRRRPRTRTTTWSTTIRRRSAARAPSATRRRRGCRTRARAVTSATSASRTPCSRTTPRSSSAAGRRRFRCGDR